MRIALFGLVLLTLLITGDSASSSSDGADEDWINTNGHIGAKIAVPLGLFGILLGWIYFLYSINNKPSAPRDDQWYVAHTRKMTAGNEQLAEQMNVIQAEIADLDNDMDESRL